MTKILSKRRVFTGKVVRVDELDLEFENKKKNVYEIVTFHVKTGVCALPVIGKDIILVKHFQIGTGTKTYSLPSGGLHEGEEPEARMQLELQEEIGYKAGKLKLMFRPHILPGYIGEEPGYIYLAEDLVESRLEGDEEFEIEVVRIPLTKAVKMITSGEIIDSRVIMAVMYYMQMKNRH